MNIEYKQRLRFAIVSLNDNFYASLLCLRLLLLLPLLFVVLLLTVLYLDNWSMKNISIASCFLSLSLSTQHVAINKTENGKNIKKSDFLYSFYDLCVGTSLI
jgi:hypothetical protein